MPVKVLAPVDMRQYDVLEVRPKLIKKFYLVNCMSAHISMRKDRCTRIKMRVHNGMKYFFLVWRNLFISRRQFDKARFVLRAFNEGTTIIVFVNSFLHIFNKQLS